MIDCGRLSLDAEQRVRRGVDLVEHGEKGYHELN